jgi:hypothetical protein
VAKAKDFLQNLIREKDMPPKPALDIDMAEFRHMRNLMIKVQDKAKENHHRLSLFSYSSNCFVFFNIHSA